MWLAESRRAGGTGPTRLSGCMQMLERAIRKFMAAGLRPQAQAFETPLARLKATEGK